MAPYTDEPMTAAQNSTQKALLNLQRGWPSARLCARQQLADAAVEVLAEGSDMTPILEYGPGQGYAPLRDAIVKWLSDGYALSAEPTEASRICVTNGASASLTNIVLKFADPTYTRRVFMVEPTYFLACPIFEDCGFRGKLRGIPEVQDGIDLDFLLSELVKVESEIGWPEQPLGKTGANYPHVYKYILYCTATFANPSAKTMSVDVRKRLVKIARQYDILLVSDDVYDFLSWPVSDKESDSSMEVVPARLVDVDRALGSSHSGGNPTHFASTIVEHTLRTGSLQAHISDVVAPEYHMRYHVYMRAVDELLLPLGYANEAPAHTSGIAGGFFSYLRTPKFLASHRIYAKTVAAIALRDYNLRIAFGHMFVVAGDAGSLERAEQDDGFGHCVRLCWAWLETGEILEAIQRLADCTKAVRARLEAGEDVSAGAEIGIK